MHGLLPKRREEEKEEKKKKKKKEKKKKEKKKKKKRNKKKKKKKKNLPLSHSSWIHTPHLQIRAPLFSLHPSPNLRMGYSPFT